LSYQERTAKECGASEQCYTDGKPDILSALFV